MNPPPLNLKLAHSELNQRLLQANSQLMDLAGQLQQDQEQAQATALQAEHAARRLKVKELDLAQLSANNRRELSQRRARVVEKTP